MNEGPIKVAQIGCGHWGRNLARNFAELGVLAAVADADPATAERIGGQHGAAVRDFDAILADSAISAVSLASPAASHAEMALAALRAGKHVFVEKPLALSPADGEAVVAAADQAGRVLMVGHLLHYHPIFLRLKALVEAGELGRLRYLYSNRLSLGKVRIEENVLWSFAPHDLSMILALAGEQPDHVAAEGAAILTPEIADWALCRLSFPSGLRAHVQASWLHPFKEQRLTVVGDEGMAVFEDSISDWSRRLALYRHRIDRSGTVPLPVKAEPEYVAVPQAEPLRAECQHFIECAATGARPRTDGREGLAVLTVLDRAEASLAASLARSQQ
jgi:predicted dehydrogenase